MFRSCRIFKMTAQSVALWVIPSVTTLLWFFTKCEGARWCDTEYQNSTPFYEQWQHIVCRISGSLEYYTNRVCGAGWAVLLHSRLSRLSSWCLWVSFPSTWLERTEAEKAVRKSLATDEEHREISTKNWWNFHQVVGGWVVGSSYSK